STKPSGRALYRTVFSQAAGIMDHWVVPLSEKVAGRDVSLSELLNNFHQLARDAFGALCVLLRSAHTQADLPSETGERILTQATSVAALLCQHSEESLDEVDVDLVRAVVLLADHQSRPTPGRLSPRGWFIVPNIERVEKPSRLEKKLGVCVEDYDFSDLFSEEVASVQFDRVLQVNFELERLAKEDKSSTRNTLVGILKKLATQECDIICAQEIPMGVYDVRTYGTFTCDNGDEWDFRLYKHGKHRDSLPVHVDHKRWQRTFGEVEEAVLCAVRKSAYSFLDEETVEKLLQKKRLVSPLTDYLPANSRGVVDVFLRRKDKSILHFGMMHAVSSWNQWFKQVKAIDQVLGDTCWKMRSAWSELSYAFIVGDLNTKLDCTEDKPAGDNFCLWNSNRSLISIKETLHSVRLCNRTKDTMANSDYADRCYDQMLVPLWYSRVELAVPPKNPSENENDNVADELARLPASVTKLMKSWSDHLPVLFTVPVSRTEVVSAAESFKMGRLAGQIKLLREVLSQRRGVPDEALNVDGMALDMALATIAKIVAKGIALVRASDVSEDFVRALSSVRLQGNRTEI
ncbi:MAG: hypothetical protein MHM6MM_005296, partial [Cercozoa sp. M6MM]